MSTDKPEEEKAASEEEIPKDENAAAPPVPSTSKISSLKKVLGGGVVIVLLAILVISLSLDSMIKAGVETGVQQALGLDLKIEKLTVGILSASIRIEGMTVGNPEGFGGESLAKIPLIHIDYKLSPIFSKKMHCPLVEVNVEEVSVVKNKDGEVNLNRLKAIADEMIGSEEPGTEPEPSPEVAGEYQIQIDKLYLTLSHVRYKNLAEADGKDRKMELGLNREEFRDLTSIDQIVQVVILKTVTAAGLANIGVAVNKITGGLKTIGGKGMDAVGSAGDVLKSAGGVLKETGGVLKETGSKLGGKLKGLFKKREGKD
jgi:hypothetical protein